MSFSTVILTHNESETLPRLIASMNGWPGEKLVLDGSSDNTAQVARGLGCKVIKQGKRFIHVIEADLAKELNAEFVEDGEPRLAYVGQKIFDFAEARNFAASQASNDMVAMPDADEVYKAFIPEKVDEVIAGGGELLKATFVFNHDQFGNPDMVFNHLKFYNRTKFQWDYRCPVHEALKGEGRQEMLPESVYKLEHYQNPRVTSTSAVAGLAWAQHTNPCERNSFYLGRELMATGRWKSAIAEFKRRVLVGGWTAEVSQAMVFMAQCYQALGLEQEKLDWLHRAFAADSSRREPLMLLADHWFRKGDYQKTACYAAAALQIAPNLDVFTSSAYYGYLPHDHLYWAKWYLGDREGAKHHFRAAISYNQSDPRYLNDAKLFGLYTNGIEGWMTQVELEWLHETAKTVNSIAEIGSWKGRSTHALCSGCPGTVTAIDHFGGSKGFDYEEWVHSQAAKDDQVYKDFCANTKEFTNLAVNRKASLDAAKDYQDGAFDTVFIDAEHTYEGVKADIEAWYPKARRILCGHDYDPQTWPSVVKAVDEMFGKPDEVHGTIWAKRL